MYIFSNALFSPMNEAIILLICLVSRSCPSPTPGMPALFETTVKSFNSDRSLRALIRELGTPLKPNPPTRIVVLLFMSLIASWAESTILLIFLLAAVEENCRREPSVVKRRSGILEYVYRFSGYLEQGLQETTKL